MAQKTLKINIFPVFSLLIREFWIKNISILLQILHTPQKFKNSLGGVLLLSAKAGATPTAWCRVGMRKPEPYTSLSKAKGEYGEAGPRAPRVNKATCGRIPPLPPFCQICCFMTVRTASLFPDRFLLKTLCATEKPRDTSGALY